MTKVTQLVKIFLKELGLNPGIQTMCTFYLLLTLWLMAEIPIPLGEYPSHTKVSKTRLRV